MARVRMKDIAEACGVSRTAVSLALNNRYVDNINLSEVLRKRIKHVSREMGYQPNRNAVALCKGRNPAIGIFLPSSRGGLVYDLMCGMSDISLKCHYPVFFSSGYSSEKFTCFLENAKIMSNSGIIAYFPFHDAIYLPEFRDMTSEMIKNGKLEDFPYQETERHNEEYYLAIDDFNSSGGQVVLLNEVPEIYTPKDSRVKYVVCNDVAGGEMAATHLLERGCETFYAISSYARCFRDRHHGYRRILEKAGEQCISFNIWMLTPEIVSDKTLSDIFDKIKTGKRPIGLFLLADCIAIHAYEYFKSQGFEIGKDIRIIGYDDSELTKYMVPGLTSIQQHFQEAGGAAMKTMIAMLDGKNVESQIITPELMIREST